MGLFKEYIHVSEAFNTKYKLKWSSYGPVRSASFDTGDTSVTVQIAPYSKDGMDSIMVNFYTFDDASGDMSSDMLNVNKGDELKIISGVVQVMFEYINKHNPDRIEFSAKGRSRTTLYRRGAKKIAQKLGYKVKEERDNSEVTFIIYNDKQTEAFEGCEDISEVFNTKVKVDWVKGPMGDPFARFDVDGRVGEIMLVPPAMIPRQKAIFDDPDVFDEYDDGDGAYEIILTVDGAMDITGKGKATEILSITANAIIDIVKNSGGGISHLMFSAKEPSRRKLYSKLAPMLAKVLKFKYKKSADNKAFFIYKDG